MDWLTSDAARAALGLVAAGAALVLAAKVFGLLFLRARTPFRVGGPLAGAIGEVTDWRGEEGFVMMDGESWRAASRDPLQPGDAVAVKAVRGLTLEVSKSRGA